MLLLPQPRRAAPWLVAGCALGVLVPLSWRHWASPFVDFGRELYAAWRLAEGDRLHADLAWFNGPLSPWWNGRAFALFGDKLLVLVAVNLSLIAVLLGLLLKLTGAMFDRWTALAAALVAPALFLVSQPLSIGNYNFLTPYSHDLTHGLVLGVIALWAAWRAAESSSQGTRGAWSVIAGAAVGAAFLTKPETFLAASLGWLVCLWLGPTSWSSRLARCGIGIAAGAAIVGAAYAQLRGDLAHADALHALLGAWPYAVDGRVQELPFYGQITGLGHPAIYARAALRACLRLAALGAACAVLAFAWKRVRTPRLAVLTLAGTLLHAAWFGWAPWMSIARPLPLIVAGALVASSWHALAGPPELRSQAALRAGFAALAAGLLLKIPLNARWAHYGFALTLPGTLLAAGLVIHDLPRLLARKRPQLAGPAQVLALTFWLVAAGAGLRRSLVQWSQQSETFGSGSDQLRALPLLAGPLQSAHDFLAANMRPNETLLVLPEGVMLNYQLRVKSPTPYVNFMPPELLFWGETELLESLRSARPDYVVLVHKDVREYGYRAFGDDYGAELYRWVRSEHSLLATYGAVPFVSPAFGVAVYARRAD